MTTHRFKCVVLGDSGVGKTSLLTRFVKEEFRSTAGSRSTISAALLERSVELDDGSIVELEIWDTAGQERFRSLNTPMYYRGAAGAILCYDCCDEDSWKHIPGWYSQLCMMGERNCVVALCASKLDLAIQGKRKISAETASDFVKKEAIRVFRETSAKTGENVEPLFVALATAMVTQAAKTTADVQSNTNNLRFKGPNDANENRRPNSACC